jgi:hypothetical protein
MLVRSTDPLACPIGHQYGSVLPAASRTYANTPLA